MFLDSFLLHSHCIKHKRAFFQIDPVFGFLLTVSCSITSALLTVSSICCEGCSLSSHTSDARQHCSWYCSLVNKEMECSGHRYQSIFLHHYIVLFSILWLTAPSWGVRPVMDGLFVSLQTQTGKNDANALLNQPQQKDK